MLLYNKVHLFKKIQLTTITLLGLLLIGCSTKTEISQIKFLGNNKVKHVQMEFDGHNATNFLHKKLGWVKTGIQLGKGDRILMFFEGSFSEDDEFNLPIYRKIDPNQLIKVPYSSNIYYSKAQYDGEILMAQFHHFQSLKQLDPDKVPFPIKKIKLHIFSARQSDELLLPEILGRYIIENPDNKQLAAGYQKFMEKYGNQLATQRKEQIIWNRYLARGKIGAFIKFIEKYPTHPKNLTAYEIVNDKLIEAYKNSFWDLDRYLSNKETNIFVKTNRVRKTKRAIRIFEKASAFGFSLADFILADIYYLGLMPIDSKKSFQYATASASQENIFGKFLKARMLYKGIGTKKNIIQAEVLFKSVAPEIEKRVMDAYRLVDYLYPKNELPLARFSLAWMLSNGVGVPKNTERAFELYESSERSGYLPARYNLALHYLKYQNNSQWKIKGERIIGYFADKAFARAKSNLNWLFHYKNLLQSFNPIIEEIYNGSEQLLWERINETSDFKFIDLYLFRYPDGEHIEPVRLKKKQLMAKINIAPPKSNYLQVKIGGKNTFWPGNDSGLVTYNKALKYCEESTQDGSNNWRVPKINEITTFFEDYFNLHPNRGYWTLQGPWGSTFPYYLKGRIYNVAELSIKNYVLCVRD